jgi:two-component system, OmpR family, sensor kinase
VSLRARLLAAFAYVLVLVIVALLVPLVLNLSRRVDAEVKSEAQGQAALLAASASGRLDDERELDRLVRGSAERLGGRVIFVDDQGRLLADSAGSGLRSASYANRPEIAQALGGETAQGTRYSDLLDADLLFTAVPVVETGRTEGAVRVTQSVSSVNSEVRSDVVALVGVGLIALLLGLGVAWLLAGSLARPLRGLARTARRVSGGDLDARASVEGSTEQREVAGAFNEMTGRLSTALRSQSEFVANASHQLRTPLTGLRLRLEAAGLKTDEPAVRRDLAAAEHETERLAALIGDLLMLARERERPEPDLLSLSDVAEAARERWEASVEHAGGRLHVAGDGDPVVASAAADLAVMLDNLVENAVNYAPPGSDVGIEFGARADEAWVAVLDAGPGIPAEERERVFERFYRGSASARGVQGTGLGLPLVRALAERWGGAVRLESRSGGGTRAEVRLPLQGVATDPSPDPELDESLPEQG